MKTESEPSVTLSTSVCHCTRAITGQMTSVPPEVVHSPQKSWEGPASPEVLPPLCASAGWSAGGRRPAGRRCSLRCVAIREMAWMVLPMPISSARMPPRTSPFSWSHIQARPTFWKRSSGVTMLSGASRSLVRAATLWRSTVSGSSSWRCAGGSWERSSRAAVARWPSSSLSMPAMLSSATSVGMREHSRCCQRVMTPHPGSSTSTPRRTARSAMTEPQTRQCALPVLANSMQ
mmetsp:Transcript_24409/g.66276  ORF Transcript_24409/g.66276 Transcript_24409/m.66276 type:complete len:233 (-) Transcript_24409:363-1061(-)